MNCHCFQTTKVQGFLHRSYSASFSLLGFCLFQTYFLGFLMEYRHQPLPRLWPPLLSLSEWGKERWRVGGRGVPSRPASIHPTSLVPRHQSGPHLQHHHRHTVVACHRIAQFRQDSFRFRDVYRLFWVFCLFVFIFFTTAITTAHIGLCSILFRHHSSDLSSFLFSTLKKKCLYFLLVKRMKKIIIKQQTSL